MYEFRGVAMTDEVNLYGHKFEVEGIIKSYSESYNDGMPSFINHDHTKHLGWTILNGIYFEPGKAYLTNSFFAAENEKEDTQLKSISFKYLYEKRYLEDKDRYDELAKKLSPNLSSQNQPCWVNAVSFYDKGIVAKVLPKLANKTVDGLIDINMLNPIMPGVYQFGDFLIFAHCFFRRGFSRLNTLNDAFLSRIEKLIGTKNEVKIALDLDLIGLAGTETRELEYQYWWGPKFDENISNIPYGVTRHENEEYNHVFSNIVRTEFGWYEQDGIRTFESEEITDVANLVIDSKEYYGCRFVHSMVDKNTNLPYHLDGAVRAYDDEKMITRLDINIDSCERDTVYTKIWRIDNKISIKAWKELITHYYRDNMLVGEYFGGVDEKIKIRHKKEKPKEESEQYVPLRKYVPTNINAGDGIRFSVRYGKIESIPQEFDICVRSNQVIYTNGNFQKYFENETITLVKMLKSVGVSVRVPYMKRMAFEDTVFNFPIFLCKSHNQAVLVLESVLNLCNLWEKNNDDRLISICLSVNYQNENVTYSFAGHVNDFCTTFNKAEKLSIPEEKEVVKWCARLYEDISKYNSVNGHPYVLDVMQKNGQLIFNRQFIDPTYIVGEKYKDNSKILTLRLPKQEVYDISESNLCCAPVFTVNSSICSVCGKDYYTCDCVKFVQEVTEIMKDVERLGAFWTNRHADDKCRNSKIEILL